MIKLFLALMSVLEFWFGPEENRLTSPEARAEIWFRGGAKVDREIQDLYFERFTAARYGKLDRLKTTPKGRLELVILLDQFSRNIYRDQPEAFATDSYALALVLEGINNEEDLKLLPIERVFFYMPLQHAEDLAIQELSIHKYERLVAESDERFKPIAERVLWYARLHRDIIARFGHFPHRNATLHRTSTPEEIAFLQEENSSF